jgi:tripartite-type tricarboxylate transporter receptor subunit TctC
MTGIFAVGDKTPKPIITRLNQEILRFLDKPEIKEQFLKSGVEMVGSSPEQFAEAIKSDIIKMGKLIKDIGLRIE